jgi:hypothetical protein
MHGWLTVRDDAVIRPLNDFRDSHIFNLEHVMGFQLQHWALKIMSFLISANRLIVLTAFANLYKEDSQLKSSPLQPQLHIFATYP